MSRKSTLSKLAIAFLIIISALVFIFVIAIILPESLLSSRFGYLIWMIPVLLGVYYVDKKIEGKEEEEEEKEEEEKEEEEKEEKEEEARNRRLAEEERKARAAKRRLAEQEKKASSARELKDSLKCLELSAYDLARIVQGVVDEKDFEEDKKILSVFKKNKSLLNDGMNDLCGSFYDDFEHSIKLFLDSVGYKINYRYDAVKEKLDSLVHRCIDCSKDLIAERLGLEISNSNSADSTPIRKTRKWE